MTSDVLRTCARLARAMGLVATLAIWGGLLAACGGGGGGSGSSGGSGGGGTPQSVLPAQFSATLVEGSTPVSPQSFEATFLFYAPTEDMPTSTALVGVDATPFTVFISASDANAAGFRTITWRITASQVFDYENPQDENRDNIYSFQFTMVYRGQTLTSNVAVRITDISDGVATRAVTLQGDTLNQLFGRHIFPIPDITGDGRPELGASIQSGLGPATAYIIGSEFYTSVDAGPLSIANLGTQGTRFTQTPPATPHIPIRTSRRPNMLSVAPRATGGGVDMLLSDASRDRFYLFAITGPSDYAALRGNVDPATIANAIVYTPPATGYQHEARLIGDVNGDGHNDIYVTWANAPFVVINNTVRDSGIVFGRPATDAADRQRNVTYDITLRATLNICCEPGLPNLETYLLDDISGDGFPDLMLYAMSEFTQGSMTLIRSPVLRGPTPKIVDMTFATPDASNFTAYTTANIFEIDDLDADGIPSYLIGESAIDGDTLNAAPGLNVLDLDAYSLRFRAGTNAGFMAPIGNVTSDTVPDYVVSFNGQKGGLLFSGDLIKRAQTQPSPDPAFPGSRNIELRVIPYATFESLRPVNLGSAGLVAFGAASNDFSSTTLAATAGMIVLVKESDIRRSATTAPAGNVGIAPPLIVN